MTTAKNCPKCNSPSVPLSLDFTAEVRRSAAFDSVVLTVVSYRHILKCPDCNYEKLKEGRGSPGFLHHWWHKDCGIWQDRRSQFNDSLTCSSANFQSTWISAKRFVIKAEPENSPSGRGNASLKVPRFSPCQILFFLTVFPAFTGWTLHTLCDYIYSHNTPVKPSFSKTRDITRVCKRQLQLTANHSVNGALPVNFLTVSTLALTASWRSPKKLFAWSFVACRISDKFGCRFGHY